MAILPTEEETRFVRLVRARYGQYLSKLIEKQEEKMLTLIGDNYDKDTLLAIQTGLGMAQGIILEDVIEQQANISSEG